MTTELVSLYTTVCPVTNQILDGTTYPQVNAVAAAPATSPPVASASAASSSAPGMSSSSSSFSSPMTTSTVFTSSVYTVSSCAPGAAACSSRLGSVTTEQVALYTTVCPVQESSSSSKPPVVLGSSSSSSSGHLPVQSGSAAPDISPVVGAAPYANASMSAGPMVAGASLPSAAVVAGQPPLWTTSTVFQTNVYSKCTPCMRTIDAGRPIRADLGLSYSCDFVWARGDQLPGQAGRGDDGDRRAVDHRLPGHAVGRRARRRPWRGPAQQRRSSSARRAELPVQRGLVHGGHGQLSRGSHGPVITSEVSRHFLLLLPPLPIFSTFPLSSHPPRSSR